MIALTALALAARPLSAHILAWCVSRDLRVRPGTTFAVTMTPIAVCAVFFGITISLIPQEIPLAGFHILIGLGLGAILILLEWGTARFIPPRSQRQFEATPVDACLRTDEALVHAGGIARIYRSWSTPQKLLIAQPWALAELCLVAVLEEVLYRGVIGFVALTLAPPPAAIGLLILSAFLFGLSHDAFGARQIVLKTVYAMFLTGATLLTGSLLPAIVAHVALNTYSWAETRRWLRAVQAQGSPR